MQPQTTADTTRLALEVQIANLYDVFRVYTVIHPIAGSPIAVSKEMQDALAAKPFRLMTGEDLDRFAFKAMSTWGTETDFKHFLPRILELLAFDRYSFSVAWGSLIIYKLVDAGLSDGPENERQCVLAYLHALWDYILEVYPSRSIEVWDFVERIHHVDSLEFYLDVWQSHLTEQAAQYHLADFVRFEFDILHDGDGILRHKPEALMGWLTTPDKQAALEQAFFNCEDRWFAEIISESAENLKLLQTYL
jgi:hypothetical protein